MKAAAAYSIEPRKYPRSQSFARILGKKSLLNLYMFKNKVIVNEELISFLYKSHN